MSNTKKWFLRRGIAYTSTSTVDNGFDLLRWLKRMLTQYLNIEYYDKCCDSDKTTFPVRYNSETPGLEYFNGTEWVAAT